ncbi:hypothetical protein AMATHDRAFT_192197 [Amanita thiersii Skay4041]|uniref:pyridoxal kinase n=1 Tax=Amanita thiersii Skay4041 TaxID=703135 RepID=A0A2A9NTA7_9AGAR|nr:hypothetical protein AMATHDRAFT_192197 [Amanita thiersii Skay4041]
MRGRVLSVQSHVVYGYVGNKAATFPLQLLAYDVDAINTVNYTNHAAYPITGGTKSSAAEINQLIAMLRQNELLKPHRLITGYTPTADPLSAIKDLATALKADIPDLIYLLDPVMGDSGSLYVSEDLVPVYRSMLPLATIITPNRFELEILSQIKITDLPSLRHALNVVHTQYNVPNIVLTSILLDSWLLPHLPPTLRPEELSPSTTSDPSHILCLTSQRNPSTDPNNSPISTIYARTVPLIPGYFSGVGDLFSALLLGYYQPSSPTPLQSAATHALSVTHAVLAFTYTRTLSLPKDEQYPTDDESDAKEPLRKARRARGRELALIQAQDLLRHGIAHPSVPEYPLELWSDFWSAA